MNTGKCTRARNFRRRITEVFECVDPHGYNHKLENQRQINCRIFGALRGIISRQACLVSTGLFKAGNSKFY